jgi:hypothetical protein
MPQTIGTVSVKVNSTPSIKVQSIQYLPGKTIAGSQDLIIGSPLTSRSVLTYDETTEKFIVQDVPQINGGTF